MLFAEDDPTIHGGWWAALGAVITAAITALTAAIVKVWPLISKTSAEREAAREKLRREGTKVQAKIDQDASELAARLRHDSHAQVSAEYQGIISELREQLTEQEARCEKQLKRQEEKLEEAFASINELHREHVQCQLQNERLQGRIAIVEATLERVKLTQAMADTPTRNEAIVVVGQDGIISEWNEAATMIFHWKKEEAIGKPVTMLVPQKYLAMHSIGWNDVVSKPRSVRRGPYIVEANTKDGLKIVEITLSSWLGDGDGRCFGASIREMLTDVRGRLVEPGGHKPLPVPESHPTDDAIPALMDEMLAENNK